MKHSLEAAEWPQVCTPDWLTGFNQLISFSASSQPYFDRLTYFAVTFRSPPLAVLTDTISRPLAHD